MKPRRLIYTPHIPHSSRARHDNDPVNDYGFLRRSLPGFSTTMFCILLIMLITLSSSAFSYERQGREQSLVDMVREACFDKTVVERAPGYEYEQKQSIYLVPEVTGELFQKRDTSMSAASASASASTTASDPVSILASATGSSSSEYPSSTSSAPHTSKSTFSDPDNVRDPTAVKPDDDQQSMASADSHNNAQDSSAGMQKKRHWSSRNRTAKVSRRSF